MDIKLNEIQPSEESIKNAQKTNSMKELLHFIENREKQKSFNVGDIIVCRNIKNNTLVGKASTPRKWIICHIDKYKLAYARRILSSGKISAKLKCLTIDYLHSKYEYTVDPEHVEHILLDSEDNYSPLDQTKKINNLKNKLRKINNEKLMKQSDIKDIKLGNILYLANNKLGKNIKKYKVALIKDVKNTKHKIIHVKREISKGEWGYKMPITDVSMYYKEKPSTIEDLL
jgi:hypothetical protein